MVFIIIAVMYATATGKAPGGLSLELVPIAIWTVLSISCWMQYRIAFLVAAIFGLFGVIFLFLGPESIQYDVIANYLVIPFSLRAYRELRLVAR